MRRIISVMLLAAIPEVRGVAQQVPQLRPGAAAELTAMEFSRVTDARELSDGRLLIGDAIEKQLYVVDFARNTAAKLGRVGAGPGEYRSLGRLLPAGRDTTLLVDVSGGRWLVMARDSFVGVIKDRPAMEGGRNPFGADDRGRLLGMKVGQRIDNALGGVNGGQVSGTISMANDSSWLVLVDRATGRLDTLAKYRIRPTRISTKASGGVTTSISVVMNPVSTGEQGVIFADGAVALARLDPYRVDWFINGRAVPGRPLPFSAVPLTREEKVAVLARLPRNDGEKPAGPESMDDWPVAIPPFPANGVIAGSDGNLWVKRAPSVRAPATDYDVVDRNGRLRARMHLPANEVIVSFGRGSIYVIATDDDGLQHLKRYPLPR